MTHAAGVAAAVAVAFAATVDDWGCQGKLCGDLLPAECTVNGAVASPRHLGSKYKFFVNSHSNKWQLVANKCCGLKESYGAACCICCSAAFGNRAKKQRFGDAYQLLQAKQQCADLQHQLNRKAAEVDDLTKRRRIDLATYDTLTSSATELHRAGKMQENT